MPQYAAGQRVTAAQLDGVYTAYTPVWSSSGTQPVVGNGTISGWYVAQGPVIYFGVYLLGGSTTTAGTGTYTLSLPTTAKTTTANYPVGSFSGLLDHTSAAPGSLVGPVFSGASSIGAGSGGGGVSYMAAAVGTSGEVQWAATSPFTISGANFTAVLSGFYLSS